MAGKNTAHKQQICIRFSKERYEEARRLLLPDEEEHICFLFCHSAEGEEKLTFIVGDVIGFSPDCYKRRSETSIVLDYLAKRELYAQFVRSDYTALVNCHSHPFCKTDVAFSCVDDKDDLREFAWFYDQVPAAKVVLGNSQSVHVLSMVFGQDSIDARIYNPDVPSRMVPVNQVQVVGEPCELIIPTGAGRDTRSRDRAYGLYDRQILAFGPEAQNSLANLSVGLVGAGGVGSVLAESVLRLGVCQLTIVDGDRLELSNLNRWLGASPNDVGEAKATVLRRRLCALFPDCTVKDVTATIEQDTALEALKACDLLLGAVDNHVARYLLNHIAVQYLMPYIDGATAILPSADAPLGLKARVAVVVPSTTSCLDCSRFEYYNRGEVLKQLYDPQTKSLLRSAGYIKDQPDVKAPAVLPLNMLAASAMLLELINLISGYAPLARCVNLDWIRIDQYASRADTSNFPEPPGDDCLFCAGYLGRADSEPILPYVATQTQC